jgi:hypothetical protein
MVPPQPLIAAAFSPSIARQTPIRNSFLRRILYQRSLSSAEGIMPSLSMLTFPQARRRLKTTPDQAQPDKSNSDSVPRSPPGSVLPSSLIHHSSLSTVFPSMIWCRAPLVTAGSARRLLPRQNDRISLDACSIRRPTVNSVSTVFVSTILTQVHIITLSSTIYYPSQRPRVSWRLCAAQMKASSGAVSWRKPSPSTSAATRP